METIINNPNSDEQPLNVNIPNDNERLKNKMLSLMPPETICMFRLSGLSYQDISKLIGVRKGNIYNIVRYYQKKCPQLYNGYEPIPTDILKEWLASDSDLKTITHKCLDTYGENIPDTIKYKDKYGNLMPYDVHVIPHGIMNYAFDFNANPRTPSMERIEYFRKMKWSWRQITYYYDLKALTIRTFVHREIFPKELLYDYCLKGIGANEILLEKKKKKKKFYGLSETVLADLLKRCEEGKE